MRNYTKQIAADLAGQKVLVTGCNGYIGSELINQFSSNNVDYIGIDKTESTNPKNLCFNLCDADKVVDVITSNKIDYIIHIGTHSALAYKGNFLEVFYEDMQALRNIFLGMEKTDYPTRIIYFSSTYVYSGLAIDTIVSEDTLLNPSHNFGLAKSFFEQMILRNHENSVIFRLSSVFGKGKYLHPNAIEVMAKEAINNKLLTIWGKGTRRMQYVYMEDVVTCVLSQKVLTPGIYNLGGNQYDTVMATGTAIADYYKVDIENLLDKPEGETLPRMENKKLSGALGDFDFQENKSTLIKYLQDIS